MHQLKALIWKAYKIRVRSIFGLVLDIFTPITIVILYICLKLIIAQLPPPSIVTSGNYIKNPKESPLNIKRDLDRHICKKILYYSHENVANGGLNSYIADSCGVELENIANQESLIAKLRDSLTHRIGYRQDNIDLNRSNSTRGCLIIPNATVPIYQVGLVHTSGGSFQIYHTDSAGGSVIHQPYTQGSPYHELKHPQSGLNIGIQYLEACLADALARSRNSSEISRIKWRFKSFPVLSASHTVPVLFLTFILAANLCSSLATVTRVVDDNESGLHGYIRTSGIPAGKYWIAQFIVMFIQLAVQNLLIAILLSIPTSLYLFDPISECNITIRWALLFTYSLAINTHAQFFGSLFSRASHALLTTCLLAAAYAMYPLTLFVQWSPYGFSDHSLITTLSLINPASVFEALILVMYAVVLQTNEAFNLGQLNMRIIGGGLSPYTIGGLWLFLLFQIVFTLLLTIIIDQFHYQSTKSPVGILMGPMNELFCCNYCSPSSAGTTEDVKTKTTTIKPSDATKTTSAASGESRKDPNRVCCSLRHICVYGPTVMMAHTQGDPLKLTPDQLDKLKMEEKCAQKYILDANSKRSTLSVHGPPKSQNLNEPIVLDEAIKQHVVWNKTLIAFDDLSLDFKFNQVTFVLGQTDLKELFFALILGLRSVTKGHIILDGAIFEPGTIGLARSQIGYLGERDIFVSEMTIFENLQLFGSLRDSAYTQFDSESLFILNLLHLSSRRDNMPSILTSRSSRKLALAAAAVGHTKLLLLVEPTLGLRWKPRCQVLNLLKKYKSIRSIVVDTSDIDEATAFGDRVVLLKNGQVDLEGPPEKLSKTLACGYWIVFESATSEKSINPDSLRELESITSQIFKHDKWTNLEATRRTVYQELMHVSGSTDDSVNEKNKSKPDIKQGAPVSKLDQNTMHKTIVILKVRPSTNSNAGLLNLLKMFSSNAIHGFKLTELTYESLEDVFVFRMSRAIYPDLPPDLLLSLQHRSRVKTASSSFDSTSQFSVRKMSNENQIPKVPTPMFGATPIQIMKDRVTHKFEMFLLSVAMVAAFVIIMITLLVLRSNTGPDVNKPCLVYRSSDSPILNYQTSEPFKGFNDRMMLFMKNDNYSTVFDYYKYRIGFYVQRGDDSQAHLNHWPGNKQFSGLIPEVLNKSESEYVAELIRKSKDILASIVIFNPSTGDTMVTFEPHLAHSFIAGMEALINYKLDQSAKSPRAFTSHFHTSRYNFKQAWHESIIGYNDRRFYYSLGFAFAEGIAIGSLVIAPIRHRSEVSWLVACYDRLLA